MSKNFLRLAAFFAGFAVVLGAFGAHSLKSVLSEYQLGIFETGVKYQFYHAIAIFIAFIIADHLKTNFAKRAAICFTIGMVLFSGSLYGLACYDLFPIPKIILGPLTPIGGLFFIMGWSLLFIGSYKK